MIALFLMKPQSRSIIALGATELIATPLDSSPRLSRNWVTSPPTE